MLMLTTTNICRLYSVILERLIVSSLEGSQMSTLIHQNGTYTSWTGCKKIATQNKLYAINQCKKCVGNCNDKLHTVQYMSKTWRTTSSHMTRLSAMNICGSKDINFDIIAANVGSSKNQKSIVLKVTAGSQSMLLAGDIEGSAAKTVATTKDVGLRMPDRLRSNVFQISHHGAGRLANKFEWLHAISPEQAFVSHPFIGQYGHPTRKAIMNLISIGSLGTSTQFLTYTHPFTCNKRAQKKYVPYTGNTCHHIFSVRTLQRMQFAQLCLNWDIMSPDTPVTK